MAERWKSGAEQGFSRYEVSSLCRVRRISDGKITKGNISSEGYHRYNLVHDNGEITHIKAHILGMLLYVSNPENKPTIDHKDRNPLNNDVDNNLRWATYTEQANNRGNGERKGRLVDQYTTNMVHVATWTNAKEAAAHINTKPRGVNNACAKGHLYYGYLWRYHEEILDGEIWKVIPYQELKGKEYASSFGRIRNETGKIYLCSKTAAGYMSVGLNGKPYLVHRLVAAAFFGVSDLIVNPTAPFEVCGLNSTILNKGGV